MYTHCPCLPSGLLVRVVQGAQEDHEVPPQQDLHTK